MNADKRPVRSLTPAEIDRIVTRMHDTGLSSDEVRALVQELVAAHAEHHAADEEWSRHGRPMFRLTPEQRAARDRHRAAFERCDRAEGAIEALNGEYQFGTLLWGVIVTVLDGLEL